jgi:hypothetical protein
MSGVYKSLYKRRLTTPILNAEFPLNIIQETKVSTPASDRNVNPALRRQQAVHPIGVYHMVISSYIHTLIYSKFVLKIVLPPTKMWL